MLDILLNFIGLICILISLFYINRFSKKHRGIHEEMIIIHENVKDYWIAIENILDNFQDLLEISLNKIENLQSENSVEPQHEESGKELSNHPKIPHKYENIILENIDEKKSLSNTLYNDIVKLKDIGLTNKEIARKLNKGIREVEIITKMHDI